jgi:hypothetical protein
MHSNILDPVRIRVLRNEVKPPAQVREPDLDLAWQPAAAAPRRQIEVLLFLEITGL